MNSKVQKLVLQNVNDIYAYILTPTEIKKLTHDILKLINVKNRKRKIIISEKDILLITYADTIIDKNKKSFLILENFLKKFTKQTLNIIHILPFNPSSSDGGFSVIDYFKLDSKHGTWRDVKRLSKSYRLMVDFVLNHASKESRWFKNFLNSSGEGKDFFLSLDKEFNTNHIIRARSHKLLQKFKTKSGYKFLWCTFSSDQIDFDFKNPKVLIKFIKLINFLISKGASFFRFDAVAFIWKRIESNCVNLDQAHAIVRLFRTIVNYSKNNSAIVTETNLPFHENLSYFGQSDEAHIIYNFSLAPLVINTLIKGNCSAFRRWSMSMPPAKNNNYYLNFLASHDGIGLRPIEDLINKKDLKKLLEVLEKSGAMFTYRKDKNNKLSVYEVNISLFDAFSETINGIDKFAHDRFFCAHAIMISFEGIPAFYIHSLFGTRNDYKLYKKTKIQRSINRHVYKYSYIKNQLKNKNNSISQVFYKILDLINIRKEQKAFHPNATQYTLNLGNSFFGIWRQSIDRKQSIFAIFNVTNNKVDLNINKINILDLECWYDLLSEKKINKKIKYLRFNPYQAMWITNKE